jgi:hypothetical protein
MSHLMLSAVIGNVSLMLIAFGIYGLTKKRCLAPLAYIGGVWMGFALALS